jgi:hypothetical protein
MPDVSFCLAVGSVSDLKLQEMLANDSYVGQWFSVEAKKEGQLMLAQGHMLKTWRRVGRKHGRIVQYQVQLAAGGIQ